MKKIWLFLLTVSMLFCLAACAGDGDTTGAGDGTAPQESASMDQDVTKEDLLAGATEVTVANIMNDINNNMAKANTLYMDKTFLISGRYDHIWRNQKRLCSLRSWCYSISVHASGGRIGNAECRGRTGGRGCYFGHGYFTGNLGRRGCNRHYNGRHSSGFFKVERIFSNEIFNIRRYFSMTFHKLPQEIPTFQPRSLPEC